MNLSAVTLPLKSQFLRSIPAVTTSSLTVRNFNSVTVSAPTPSSSSTSTPIVSGNISKQSRLTTSSSSLKLGIQGFHNSISTSKSSLLIKQCQLSHQTQSRTISMMVQIPPDPMPRMTVIGVKNKKFFGQDGSEECLKLMEHLRDCQRDFHLLVGLAPRYARHLHNFSHYKGISRKQALQRVRELEHEAQPQFFPLIQAAILEHRSVLGVGMPDLFTYRKHALRSFSCPWESISFVIYRYIWQSFYKVYKDTDFRVKMREYAPKHSQVWLDERACWIAARSYEYACEQANGDKDYVICAVEYHLFPLVQEHLAKIDSLQTAKDLLDSMDDTGLEPFPYFWALVAGTCFVCMPLAVVRMALSSGWTLLRENYFSLELVDPDCRA